MIEVSQDTLDEIQNDSIDLTAKVDVVFADSRHVDNVTVQSGVEGQQTRTDIIAYGDGVTEGYSATTHENAWVYKLQTLLRTAYPAANIGTAGGIGYRPAQNAAPLFTDPTAVGSPTVGFAGPGRKSLTLDDFGDTVTWSSITGDMVRVWHPEYAGIGSILIEVDGPLSPTGGRIQNFGTTDFVYCDSVTNANTVTSTGVISLQCYVEAADWTPTQQTSAICGWQGIVNLELLGTGSVNPNKLRVNVFQSSNKTCVSTTNIQTTTGWADGAGGWLRADINVSTDQVSFYYSNNAKTTARTSVTWTLIEAKALSATITGVDSIATAIIGNGNVFGGAGWLGKIYKAAGVIATAVGAGPTYTLTVASTAFDVNFTTEVEGCKFFRDAAGKRWVFSTTGGGGVPMQSGAQTVIQDSVCGTWASGHFGEYTGYTPFDQYTDIELDGGTHSIRVSHHSLGSDATFPRPAISGIQVFDEDQDKPGYLSLTGTGYYSTPDSGYTSPTGDLDVKIRVRATDYTPTAVHTLASKWDEFFGNNRSWKLFINTAGTLGLSWSTNGTAVTTATSNNPLFKNGKDYWIRATLDVDNGSSQNVVNFYRSESNTNDPTAVTWTLINTVTTAGATSIFNSGATAVNAIGSIVSAFPGWFIGRIYAAEITDGASGQVIMSPDFTQNTVDGVQNITDDQGNVWTNSGGANNIIKAATSEGIQIIQAGHGGFKASDVVGGLEWALGHQTYITDAPFVFVWYGFEEYANDINPDTYKDNMQDIITYVRREKTDVKVVMIAGWEATNASPTYAWSEYVDRIYELNVENDDTYVIDFSESTIWPQPGTAEGTASGYYADGQNLSNAGATAVAAFIMDNLQDTALTNSFDPSFSSLTTGIDTYDTFFSPEQVINGLEEETFEWLVLDSIDEHGDPVCPTGRYHLMDDEVKAGTEYGWWTTTASNGSGTFATPETVEVGFEARRVNSIRVTTAYSLGRVATGTLEYKVGGTWTTQAVDFAGGYDYTLDLVNTVLISKLRFTPLTTTFANDVGRIYELIPLYVESFDDDDIINFNVDKVRENVDSTNPIGSTAANTCNVTFENTLKDWNPFGSGQWSDYVEPDIIVRPYVGYTDRSGPFYVDFSQFADGPVPEGETGLRDMFLDNPDSQDEMGIQGGKLAVADFRGPDQSPSYAHAGGGRRGLLWRDTHTLTDNVVGPYDGSRATGDLCAFAPTLHINVNGRWLGISAWFVPPPFNWVELGVIGVDQEEFSYMDINYGIPQPDANDVVLIRSVGGYASVEVNGETILGPAPIPEELLGSSIHGVQMDVQEDVDENVGLIESITITSDSTPLTPRPAPLFKTVGTPVETAASLTINVPYPAGIVAGDDLFAVIGVKAGGTCTAPGWTDVSSGYNQVAGIGVRVLTKVAVGGEAGTLTVTNSVSQIMAGTMMRIEGVHNSTLTGTFTLASTSMPAPAMKLIGINRTAFWIGATAIDTDITVPTGFSPISTGLVGSQAIRLCIGATYLDSHPDFPEYPINSYTSPNFPAQVGTAASAANNAAGYLIMVPALGSGPIVDVDPVTDSDQEYIPLGEYYADTIEVSDEMTSVVNTRDYSKYLQEFNVEEGIFLHDVPVGRAVAHAAKTAGIPTRKIHYMDDFWRTLRVSNPVAAYTLQDSPAIDEDGIYESLVISDFMGSHDGVAVTSNATDIILGEPSIIPSKKSHSVRFNAISGKYIQVTDHADFDYSLNMSIVATITPIANNSIIISKGTNYQIAIDSSSRITFTVVGTMGTVTATSAAITLGESYFICARASGSVSGFTVVSIYVNGVNAFTGNVPGTFTTNSTNLRLGSGPSGNEYNGYLQGVAFYDRVLENEDVDRLYYESRIEEIYDFPYLYSFENTLWEGMLEWATADIGIFYFDEDGDFHYEYRNTLHDEALTQHSEIQYTFDEDVEIIGGNHIADQQTNRVTVTVNPITTINSDIQSVWRAEEGESLVVTKLRATMDDSQTTAALVKSTEEPLWLDSGYFKIDDEIIGYSSKSANRLIGLTRGEFGTTPAAHGIKTYSFENGLEGFSNSKYSEDQIYGNSQLLHSTTQAHDGTGALKMTTNLEYTNDAEIQGPRGKQALPVTNGSTTMTFWIYAATTARTVRAGVRFFDSVGGKVTDSYGTSSASTLNGWKQYSITFTPDTTKKYMCPLIYISNTVDDEVFYIDEVKVTNTRPKVREVRFYEIDYDQSPVVKVQFPHISAAVFDDTVLIESFEANAFGAKILVSATNKAGVGDTIILEGTDPISEENNYFAIAGVPLVEEQSNNEVKEESAELAGSIRRHRVHELTIDNRFIQDQQYARVLAQNLIEHFANPIPVVNLTTMGVPMIQLGDRISIGAFDQLSAVGREFWVLSTSISYDGGLNQTFILREAT